LVKSIDGLAQPGTRTLEQIDHAGSNALRIVSAGSSGLVSGSLRVSGGRLKKNIRLIRVDQVHGVSFKKRAPRAIKEIKGFAEKAMVCWHL
jgi:hypothetical protein